MGIAVIAHSPLGGPRRAIGLARSRPLAEVADAHGVAPSEVALAWVLGLSEAVIAIPGARRPETVRSAARAAKLSLDADDRAILAQAFGGSQPARRQPPARSDDAAVILVMGIPGAGKSRLAREYVGRGYVRLNRDERGGSLRQIAGALDQQMSSGVRHVVVDNTYLTRAARSYVVEAASRYGIPTHCIWLSTPLAQAQVNLVGRLLELVGRLPTPDELRTLARGSEGVLMPTSQMRAARELEPPSLEEGFASVQVKPFARPQPSGPTRTGVFVAAAALRESDWELAIAQGNGKAPHLVFDWTPDGAADMLDAWVSRLAAVVSGPVEGALCPHGTGPPRCWCRPPLPGLPLAFARAHGLEPSGSILIGARPAHRTLAATLGAHYVSV